MKGSVQLKAVFTAIAVLHVLLSDELVRKVRPWEGSGREAARLPIIMRTLHPWTTIMRYSINVHLSAWIV